MKEFEALRFWIVSLSLLVLTGASLAEVSNGGFEETYVRDRSSPEIQAMEKVGWNFQSPLVWPNGWEGTGVPNVTFAMVKDRPHSGENSILLWGQAGSSGYLSTQVKGLEKGIYGLSFWGRGKGTATLMFSGVHIVLNVKISGEWAEYSGIFRNTTDPFAKEGSLTLQAQNAEVFFDDVSVVECDVLEAAMVEESARMRREGKWLGPEAKPDFGSYKENVVEVIRGIPKLKSFAEADPIPETVELLGLLEKRVEEMRKVRGDPTVEQANEALAYSEIAKRLLVELQFEDVSE